MENSIPHIFHVDLSDGLTNESYWLQVAGEKHPLLAHNAESIAKFRASDASLTNLSDTQLTHYTPNPVAMPANQALRISVRHTVSNTPSVPNHYGIHHIMMYVPPKTLPLSLVATTTEDDGSAPSLDGTLGPFIVNKHINYDATAQAIIMHHADLINHDPATQQIILEHLSNDTAPYNYSLIQIFANYLKAAGFPTKTTGWANWTVYNASDAVASGRIKPSPAPDGSYYSLTLSPNANASAGPALTAVMQSTKNDVRLQNVKWTQQTGTSIEQIPTSTAPVSTNSFIVKPQAQVMSLATVSNVNDNWQVAIGHSNTVDGLQSSVSITNATQDQVTLHMENSFVRWLAVYVEFIDADGNSMNIPNWSPDDGGIALDIASTLGLQYDNVRYLGNLAPIDTVYGVPNYLLKGEADFTFTFPSGAVKANFYGCGLGLGALPYPFTIVIGGGFTALANFVVPALFLGCAVASVSSKKLYDIMGKASFVKDVINLVKDLFSLFVQAFNLTIAWEALEDIAEILFSKAAEEAMIWCQKQIVKGEIEDEIPFAGWVMAVVNIAADAAQIGQTIVEVATSPLMIKNTLSTTISSTVTFYPDPRAKNFPQPTTSETASYVVKMIYQQNAPTKVSPTTMVAAGSTATSFSASFVNPLGGQVKFEVDYYLDSWLAAQATTAWLPNDEVHTANVILYLVEQPVPITSTSVYEHSSILTYQNNAYQWTPSATAPTATVSNTDTNQTGNSIARWMGLSLSQRNGMLGLSWEAAGMGIASNTDSSTGQLYAFQNIDIPGLPMNDVIFPTSGFTNPSQLVYDAFPAQFLMSDGNWVLDSNGNPTPDPNDVNLGNYYIDPRKALNDQSVDGGYHLRQVTLSPSPIPGFNMSSNQMSWGRFPYFPDSIAMHPSGHVIGVNQQYCKIMVLQLSEIGHSDEQTIMARVFAGQAQNFNNSGGRAGLLFIPTAVSCTYDGTVMILEQIQSQAFSIARIQAFDLNGNPVSYFKDKNGNPSPFLLLPDSGITYLDMIAIGDVKTSYIYVLYYTNAGSNVSDYHLCIYQCGEDAPAGNLLVTNSSIAAAKINVDMWHTLYTLNYAMTTDGNGNNAGPKVANAGPAGRTVPSVSEWLLPVPV